MPYSWTYTALVAALVLLWTSGCETTLPAAPPDQSVPTSRSKTTAPSNNGRAGAAAASTRAGRTASPAAAAGAGHPAVAAQVEVVPPNGEICDREDNDGNGRIDDADVEGDGVCDCLRIASIGRPGAFGKGDLQFRTWPNAMAQHHVVPLEGAALSAERLASVDVLIVLNVSTLADVPGESPHHEFTDQEVEAFQRWVQAGGGVFTTAGYSGDIQKEVANVNKLLKPFDLAYSPTKYGLNGIVANWTAHPVSEGVKRVYTEVGAEPDGSAALTLAKDATEHVALQAPSSGAAKILVWGDEWITYASQWQAEADQQVERFWVNALTWLSRESACQHTIAP